MTPLQLDYIVNGAKVFVYRRSDGSVYASLDDFSKFGAEPVKVVRVPLNDKSTTESVLKNAKVKKALSDTSQDREAQ